MIGERLKEERGRLGLSQPEFAALVGAAKRTLIDWEKGSTSPSAVQLSGFTGAGVDVMYVLTGQRSNVASTQHLPPDEQLLLEAYRGMPAKGRKELLADMLTGSARKKPKTAGGVNVTGNNNRAAGGTYHENKE